MNKKPRPGAGGARAGWAAALAWAGGGATLLAAGVWLLRIPLADLWLRAALAERGLEADFRITEFGLDGAQVADLRLGPVAAPDAEIGAAALAWSWRGLTPRLRAVRLTGAVARLSVSRDGAVSAGSLARLGGRGAGPRPALPAIELAIESGRVLIDTPFGQLAADLASSGTLGRDFAARAAIAPVSLPGEAFALEAGQAELLAETAAEGLALRLTGSAGRLVWDGVSLQAPRLAARAGLPLDLAELHGSAAVSAAAFDAPAAALAAPSLSADLTAAMAPTGLAAQSWRAALRWRAPSAVWGERLFTLADADAGADLEGDAHSARGAWRLTARDLRHDDVAAGALRADGALEADFATAALGATATLRFSGAALAADRRARLREAIPGFAGAPPGPLLAQTEAALDRALARFDLEAPLRLEWSRRAGRIVGEAPILARAATGASLRAAPLRVDAPAFTLLAPSLGFHGRLALDLEGAGLPRATLLLDSVDWAPDAPFEADGTLAIADWSAPGARAASGELAVNLAMPQGGGGRLTLAGPARLTGPVADGRVEDLAADLNLAFDWGQGWRAAPLEGCLDARIGELEAAGLRFHGGAFAFCPGPDGALIAGDAQGRLSGGFIVRDLALAGAMAGPAANPARLSAHTVSGAFGGESDDAALDIVADAARLAIDLAPQRTLVASGGRVTARASFADQTWRIDGGFEGGALRDPSLPGAVTAIAGAWRAAPDPDGEGALIEVSAGAARIEPPPELPRDQRAPFHPMRLADFAATLRDGAIDASGAILLDAPERNLARFTARHDVASGVGAAVAQAETLEFGPGLQPFQISELARGVIVNVRGPASGTATLDWTPDTLTARGRLRLDGLSFATASIPVIENVTGDIEFDDLFALTTPPGQSVRVGVLNPGLAVYDGVVRFQLPGADRVIIEEARWPFAGGALSVAPTTLKLGAPETSLRLVLANVDAAALIARLEIPAIAATGTVEGSFPLRLTDRHAYVDDGVLNAAPGGGLISYVGADSDSFTGPARIAFQALSGFRYDSLQLRLSGDLSGDIVTQIRFSGANIGESVDLAQVSSGPGLNSVAVRNAPFRFNVTVTAPFQRLAEAAAGLGDARVLLHDAGQARPPGSDPDDAVDQTAPAPR